MERVVSESRFIRMGSIAACVLLVLGLLPARAAAQTTPTSPPADGARLWLMAGAFSTTSLGDCTDCEDLALSYRTAPSIMASGGWTLNPRTDLGAEVLWVGANNPSSSDRIRVTFLLASVQFRPWRTRGFFLRTGAGMAFVHNVILSLEGEDTAFRSKAFALDVAAGWEWQLSRHFGVQIAGAQHAAALGDLQTSTQTVENVMGNFWSLGAAVVFR
jgi:hypothetical protein